jgi:hypothetical protein
VPDIFDEVSEDLRADQARSLLRRFGGLLIAAMIATLAGVGIYTWWQEQQQAADAAVAVKFLAAQKASERALPPKDLAQQFGDIAAHAPEGYRILAQLQLAALDWDAGRHDKAVAAWHAVATDRGAPQILRDLATVTSAQHQVDTGDAAALKAELLPIVQGGGAFRPFAVQVNALLDLRLGRTKEAVGLMRSLLSDPSTPQGLRQMTQSLLVAVGNTESGGAP